LGVHAGGVSRIEDDEAFKQERCLDACSDLESAAEMIVHKFVTINALAVDW
jgi:hypothetical protein